MVDGRTGRSLQEIIKRRQQHDFVGRDRLLSDFRENLLLPLDDERRRFVYNVFGPAGVGKTWLLRRFNGLAQQEGVLTAWSDDGEGDVIAVMERIATRFDGQGWPISAFAERLVEYRELTVAARSPGEVPARSGSWPSGVPARPASFVAWLPFTIPTVGDRDNWRSGEKGSAGPAADSWPARLTEAVNVLSELFIAGLRAVAEERPVGLFFDSYDRTAVFLDDWLRGVLEGRFGELPASTILCIAGRERLDDDRWRDFEPVIARVPLEPFSDEEARLFLARKGITDEHLVGRVLQLTGRLPMLVATAVLNGADHLDRLTGGTGGSSIAWLLDAQADSARRELLLDAALPRRLDSDLLAYLTGRSASSPVIDWLRNLPFVEQRGGVWTFRDIARRSLLEHGVREAPERWADLHGQLAAYYERLADGVKLDERSRRHDGTWQAYALEALYHRLCQSPRGALSAALGEFFAWFPGQPDLARRWAETIEQAGEDAAAEEVRDWGVRLRECLRALLDGRHDVVADTLSLLLTTTDLDDRWRPEVLAWQSRMHLAAGRLDAALRGYESLVQVAPGVADYWIETGVVLARLGYYQQAADDFSRALELAPGNVTALANRGEAYRLLEAYSEALADFDRVLAEQPDNAGVLGSRGQVLLALEQSDDALADLNRAVALAPDAAWILAERGSALRSLGRYEEALADLNRSLRLDPGNVWARTVRGDVQRQLKRYDAARLDFEKVLMADR